MTFAVDLKDRLAKGCCAEVYFGTLDSRFVAAKKNFDPGFCLRKEAGFLKLCDHPNVIQLLGLHTCGGEEYLVMEIAEQGTLRQNLGKNAFSLKSKMMMIRQLCDGLEHIQARNILHRDIHVKNIFLTRIEPPHIVLGDFGSAEFFDENKTKYSSHYVLHDHVYTFKSDVKLAAYVVIEIIGDIAEHVFWWPMRKVVELVSNTKVYTKASWRRAILNAISKDPAMRPTPAELREAFMP